MLASPSLQACKEEAELTGKLFCCIDNLESFLFDAGAGAGKTYALVECLKHVVKNRTRELARNGQKVVCITYTNVAANEIIERLGISDIVIVSTIHDFLWSFMKRFQPELLQVHEDRVKEEISALERGLQDSDKGVDLGSKAEEIKQVLNENRDEYLAIHYKANNAQEYRRLIKASARLNHQLGGFLGNVARIKRTAKILVDIGLLEDCAKSISTGKSKEVQYDTFSNSDRLHRMRISHDTLIEYCRRILMHSDEVKRIFADRFPYIFIDEYQDTHIDIVAAIEDVIRFTESNDKKFLVGFFGDKAQRIYYETNESIEKIQAIQSLRHIEKKHNRRSAEEIIDVANRIRNDSINQTSVFDDAKGGSCKFYLADSSTSYDEIYEALEARCDYDFESEPPDVFMLSNKKVAEKAGFKALYEVMQKSQYYKVHYDRLNSELMSKNEMKLGNVPRALRNLIQLRRCLENGSERLSTLLPKDAIATSNVKDLQQVLECISGISASNLEAYLDKLVELIDSRDAEGLGEATKRAFAKRVGIDSFDRFALESLISESLCFETEGEGEEESSSVAQSLMELDFSVYDKWFDYLAQDNTSDLGFHTFHGTKGDEYDCVLAIAGNRYTDSPKSPRSYFDLFFEKYAEAPSGLNEDELSKFHAAQNLLYVATTRARKHFSFVYQSDEKLSGSSKANIESIFGEIIEI